MNFITENEIEQIALAILNEDLGYTVLYGPDINGSSVVSVDGGLERDYNEVVLKQRLKNDLKNKRSILVFTKKT